MFNRNAFKTSLIFLGIIFLGVVAHMFVDGDDLFVKNDQINETANVGCLEGQEIC